ncbi:fibronectin type III-like domain-contianing protein [Oceanobacillus sp. FSL K6-2867]|uniref:fibronectin type III-like domain-contianing protein n=1 Tax=Oceanobacillus sp. FSL K6-2867 TaxID=2954748 RepID=UPI0030DDC2DD
MGYRWYEANNVEPVFQFGYGLSYTTFEFEDDNLKVKKVRREADGSGEWKNKGKNGSPSGIDVSFTVTNTGDVAGKEAAQVYLTLPNKAGQPSKRLVNFEKVDVKPGESQRVTIRINQADSNHPFSYFIPEDPDNLENWADGEWATLDGKYSVHVGGSSADTPLDKTFPLNFKLNKDKGKGKPNR